MYWVTWRKNILNVERILTENLSPRIRTTHTKRRQIGQHLRDGEGLTRSKGREKNPVLGAQVKKEHGNIQRPQKWQLGWNTEKEGQGGKIPSREWRKKLENLKHTDFGKDFVPYINYWRTLHRKDINEIALWNTNSDYPQTMNWREKQLVARKTMLRLMQMVQ